MRSLLSLAVAGVALATVSLGTAQAFPVQADMAGQAPVASQVTPVAQGCGWGRWRGPWGGCRDTPYSGPLPGGGWAGPGPGNGCPAGYWRGPWGHCRDTPYHGALPGGGWKP